MRILQLCQRPPNPPIDGGAIAMNNVTLGLLELGHQVKVLTITTPKHPVQYNKINSAYLEKTELEAVFVDTSIHLMDAFMNLFESESYNVKRFVSEDFEKKLIEILEGNLYDVVLLETLYVTPYIDLIRRLSKAKIVLRSHNVEHIIWERVANNSGNYLKKGYLNFLAKKLKEYEVGVLQKIDGLLAMTNEDLEVFKSLGCNAKSISVPTGMILDSELFTPTQKEEDFSVFHIASMNWLPNVEAVEWFLKNVWHLVLQKVPQANLYLAGRDMPEWLLNYKQERVFIVGEVENARDFYKSKKVMVVPVLSGGGMRIKIIEGMAMGKNIVSTTIGAEGILCVNGEHILIADKAEEFAQMISFFLKNEKVSKELSLNAQQLIKEEYDNSGICKRIEEFLMAL